MLEVYAVHVNWLSKNDEAGRSIRRLSNIKVGQTWLGLLFVLFPGGTLVCVGF